MNITSLNEQIYLIEKRIFDYTLRLETTLTDLEYDRWVEKIEELEFKLQEKRDELESNSPKPK